MKFHMSDDQPGLNLTPFAQAVLTTCNKLLSELRPGTRPRDFIVPLDTYEKLVGCFDEQHVARADVGKFMAIMGVPVRTVPGLMPDGTGVMLRIWKAHYYVQDV